jgi:hypothetical protein
MGKNISNLSHAADISNSVPQHSNALSDFLYGLLQSLCIAMAGCLVFASGRIVEALMVFGVAYFWLFYKLCMAGISEVTPTPYVTGEAYLQQQTRPTRITKSLSSRYHCASSSLAIAGTTAIILDDEDIQFLDDSNTEFEQGSKNTQLMDEDLSAATFSVNPATGNPMLGALDIEGCAYGTRPVDNHNLDSLGSSFCEISIDDNSIDSFDCVINNDFDDM